MTPPGFDPKPIATYLPKLPKTRTLPTRLIRLLRFDILFWQYILQVYMPLSLQYIFNRIFSWSELWIGLICNENINYMIIIWWGLTLPTEHHFIHGSLSLYVYIHIYISIYLHYMYCIYHLINILIIYIVNTHTYIV